MITAIGVVVPAADEEELLPACLAALRASADELQRRRDVTVRTVVVLDACGDNSAAIATEFGVETIAVQYRCVGSARRAGAGYLLNDAADPRELWLANTDADSQVPKDWLVGMCELADAGVGLVLGTVRPAGHLEQRLSDTWYARHCFDDGHPHVHAANLGIRGDVYCAVGGWPLLAHGEDEALVQSVMAAADAPVARTARFPVTTSTRLSARAPYGFASYLRDLSAACLDGESA